MEGVCVEMIRDRTNTAISPPDFDAYSRPLLWDGWVENPIPKRQALNLSGIRELPWRGGVGIAVPLDNARELGGLEDDVQMVFRCLVLSLMAC